MDKWESSSSSSSSSSSGSIFTPLIISLAGIAATSIIIVAYHVLLVRYCIRRHRRSSVQSTQIAEGAHITIGVEQHVLDSIPVLHYTKQCNDNSDNSPCQDQTECVVCLGELEEGDKVRLLPNCGHVFHVPCIDVWFFAHTNCPICRAPIAAEPDVGPTVEHEPFSLNIVQFVEQQGGHHRSNNVNGGANDGSSGSLIRPNGLLRHSLSFMLPVELKKEQHCLKLKRSLSMDQSFVVIDVQRAAAASPPPSSPKRVLMENNRSYGTRLLRPFSQTRMGHGVTVVHGILPR